MQNKNILFIPNSINFILINTPKQATIFLFSNFFFYTFIVHKFHIFYNTFLNYFEWQNYWTIKTYWQKIIKLWTFFFLKKYIILGRGFKLKKTKTSTYWNFNIAVRKQIFLKQIIIQKFSKKKFLLIYSSLSTHKHKCFNQVINQILNKNIFLKKIIKPIKYRFYLKKKKQ